MHQALDIIAEPYANWAQAVGKLLFLANVGEVLLPGQVLCIHSWHWPDNPELQDLEPHVTHLPSSYAFIKIESWRKQVGDIVQEGELIGHYTHTEQPPELAELDESLSYNEREILVERNEARRAAYQLGVDLNEVVPIRDREVTVQDVHLWWEKTQDVWVTAQDLSKLDLKESGTRPIQ